MNVPTGADPLLARDFGLTPALKRRLGEADTWVFDLDNTLYPAGGTVWPMIDERITRYLAALLGIDGMSARGLQKYYYRRYGTTLRGLIEDHRIAPGPFLDFVHDIDRTSLAPNPALVEAIAALPGRKLILTNGSRDHALRTTERLGFLADAFDGVYDIVASEMIPKPDAAAYERFFALHAVDPARSVMVEDLSKNLVVPHRRGMATILVVPPLDRDNREPWERLGGTEPHVDVVTDDLSGFLAALMLGGGCKQISSPSPLRGEGA